MTTAFLLDTALYYFVADHAALPLVARAARRAAVLQDGAEMGYYPMRFYNRRLVGDREAEDGARHLRQPQCGAAPSVRRLLDPQRDVGDARSTESCAGARPSSRTPGRTWCVRGRSRRARPRPSPSPSRAAPRPARRSGRPPVHADRARHRRVERHRPRARGPPRPGPARPRPRRAKPGAARDDRARARGGVRNPRARSRGRPLGARRARRDRGGAVRGHDADRRPRQRRGLRRPRLLRRDSAGGAARDDPGQRRCADSAHGSVPSARCSSGAPAGS